MASSAVRSILSSLFIAETASGIGPLLAECNKSFDFWVATEVGVVDDSCKVALKADSSFLNELWVGVGFLPEVGDGEGRELELNGGPDTSSLSRL